jgi:hypothetical protein
MLTVVDDDDLLHRMVQTLKQLQRERRPRENASKNVSTSCHRRTPGWIGEDGEADDWDGRIVPGRQRRLWTRYTWTRLRPSLPPYVLVRAICAAVSGGSHSGLRHSLATGAAPAERRDGEEKEEDSEGPAGRHGGPDFLMEKAFSSLRRGEWNNVCSNKSFCQLWSIVSR